MPDCTCCKKDRVAKKQPPRSLQEFVIRTDKSVARLHVCEYCDGEELLRSLTEHEEQ